MPGFNKTGPMGQGSMTGRRMGRCTPEGRTQNSQTQSPDENNENTKPTNWFGRGPGFGWRIGGRGRGLGRQNRFRRGF